MFRLIPKARWRISFLMCVFFAFSSGAAFAQNSGVNSTVISWAEDASYEYLLTAETSGARFTNQGNQIAFYDNNGNQIANLDGNMCDGYSRSKSTRPGKGAQYVLIKRAESSVKLTGNFKVIKVDNNTYTLDYTYSAAGDRTIKLRGSGCTVTFGEIDGGWKSGALMAANKTMRGGPGEKTGG